MPHANPDVNAMLLIQASTSYKRFEKQLVSLPQELKDMIFKYILPEVNTRAFQQLANLPGRELKDEIVGYYANILKKSNKRPRGYMVQIDDLKVSVESHQLLPDNQRNEAVDAILLKPYPLYIRIEVHVAPSGQRDGHLQDGISADLMANVVMAVQRIRKSTVCRRRMRLELLFIPTMDAEGQDTHSFSDLDITHAEIRRTTPRILAPFFVLRGWKVNLWVSKQLPDLLTIVDVTSFARGFTQTIYAVEMSNEPLSAHHQQLWEVTVEAHCAETNDHMAYLDACNRKQVFAKRLFY